MSQHITCQALSKRYQGIKALDKLELSLEITQTTGIVGPNGAGKSTLFAILCGFITPSSGRVSILGNPPDSSSNKGKLSLLPQDTAMFKGIDVFSQLKHYARLHGFSNKEAGKEVERVIALVQAKNFCKQLPETLSFGQRKRIMLAQSLIGSPQLILMDEPTAGLDPVAATEVRHLLRQLSNQYSLVISSHNLNEIEDICSDIVILNKGKLVTHCSLSELTQTRQCFSLRLEQENNGHLSEILKDIDGISKIVRDNSDARSWLIHYENVAAEQLQIDILSVLAEKKLPISELRKGKALADEISEILKENK